MIKKQIPILSSEIVRLVLSGDDNEKIIKKLGLKGSKNLINWSINTPREWFASHPRETKYARELLSVFKAEEIQSRFSNFCSMPKNMQEKIKDVLLQEIIDKIKKARASARRILAIAQ